MFGGLARTPASIGNIPTNGYVIFPNSEDNGLWYSKDFNGVVKPVGSANPYIGSQRAYLAKTTQQNTTSTTFQEYMTMNVSNNNGVTAKHELLLNFVWGYGSASSDFRARLVVDGQPFGEEFRMEPKDPGTNQRNYNSFFTELDLAPGPHTITLEFAAESGGTEARMYSAKMRSMRVE